MVIITFCVQHNIIDVMAIRTNAVRDITYTHMVDINTIYICKQGPSYLIRKYSVKETKQLVV